MNNGRQNRAVDRVWKVLLLRRCKDLPTLSGLALFFLSLSSLFSLSFTLFSLCSLSLSEPLRGR